MPRQITHRILIPGRNTYSPEWIQNQHNALNWQKYLREIHETDQRAQCKCPGKVVKELIPFVVGGTYFLKKVPHTGPEHDFDCAFHETRIETCGLKAYNEGVVTFREDGGPSIRLEVGLLPLKAPNAANKPSAVKPGSGRSKPAMTLLGLIHLLWEHSRFNLWYPKMLGTRTGTVLSSKVIDAASDITVSRHRLTKYLALMAPGTDRYKDLYPTFKHNQKVLKSALAANGRVLLLGEINPDALIGTKDAYFLNQDHYFLKVSISGNALESLRRNLAGHFRAIAALGFEAPPRVLVLAAATLRTKDSLTFADVEVCSGMLTTTDYVPVDSSHEWRLARQLIDQQRSFFKPLRFDADVEEVLPDFVLIDTDRRYCPLEVYGMTTKEYNERRREKEAYYLATFGLKGWWSWDALQQQAIPELPAQIVKEKPVETE